MKTTKIAASIFALTLIAGTATGNAGVISKIVPSNCIMASAGVRQTSSDGNWLFEGDSDNTAKLCQYIGNSSRVYIPESVKDSKTQKSYIVTELSNSIMTGNTNITYVAIPKGITRIPYNAFKNAFNLKEVALSHCLHTIDSDAFHGTSIKQIILPKTLQTIGKNAFQDTPLESVTLNDGLTQIGGSAFQNTKIRSITFPSSLEEIGSNAFASTKITSLTLPSSLKKINSEAFKDCTNLNTVTINGNCTMANYIFSGCNQITNINMSMEAFENAVQTGALGNCPNLTRINNTKIVRYYSDGEPYFAGNYSAYITVNFAKIDRNNVSFMNQYLDAEIKYIVKKETAGCSTDAEKIRALHDWVYNKVNYAYTSDGKEDVCDETACDSAIFMKDRAVCEGYAKGFALLLREAGIEAYYTSSGSHAWNIVRLGDYYFHIDTCHDGGDNKTKYTHYLKSDLDIKKCSSGHNTCKIQYPTTEYHHNLYSRLEKISIIPTPECKWSLGDANMDGKVDKDDDIYICNINLHNKPLLDKTLTDVNGDGNYDTLDAIGVHSLFSDNYLV